MKRRYFYFNDKLALEKFMLHVDPTEEEANNQEMAVNYAERARKKQKVNTVASSAYKKWVYSKQPNPFHESTWLLPAVPERAIGQEAGS
jgi:hypothetical protein